MTLLAWIKRTRHQLRPYCHQCGRNRHAFFEPDVVSRLVAKKTGKDTEFLCYECFCTACEKAGFPSPVVWQLTSFQGSSQDLCRTARGGKKPPKEPPTVMESCTEGQPILLEYTIEGGHVSAAPFSGEDVGGCG